MSAFYDNMADTALRLIRLRGAEYTLRRPSRTGNFVEGSVDTGAPSTTPVHALVLPASSGTVEAFDNRIKSERTLMYLRFVLMAAKGVAFEPLTGDVLEIAGEDWQVLGSTPLAPDGTPLVYKMGIERK